MRDVLEIMHPFVGSTVTFMQTIVSEKQQETTKAASTFQIVAILQSAPKFVERLKVQFAIFLESNIQIAVWFLLA